MALQKQSTETLEEKESTIHYGEEWGSQKINKIASMHCPGIHKDTGYELTDCHHNFVLMELILELERRVQMTDMTELWSNHNGMR